MRRPLIVVVLLVILGIPAPPSQAAGQGVFSIHCSLSHSLMDDPIVLFGLPDASHLHEFFGNISTNAFSTYADMTASGTSCKFSKDTAGYWAPALVAPDGSVVHPSNMNAYYRATPAGGTFVAFPPDLRLIAGYPTVNTGTNKILGYNCQDSEPYSPVPIDCTTHKKHFLKAHIDFPNCWDGVSTDSPDHRSHVVYPVLKTCPADHPYKVPHLNVNITYPVTDARGYYLVSDMDKGVTDGRSLHSDFWNTWDQAALQDLVTNCLNAGKTCLDVTG